MPYEKDSSGNLGWFLFGAALGAAAAFLTTPRSGRETRDLLSERSGDVAKRAQEWAGEAQSHAGEWLDKRRERFAGQTPRRTNAFAAANERVGEKISEWANPAPGCERAARSPRARREARSGLQPPRRAADRRVCRRAGHRRPRRQVRDEGDAAGSAAVVRSVGLLSGQGRARAPQPRQQDSGRDPTGRARRRSRR